MTRRRDQRECQHLAAIEDKYVNPLTGSLYLAWCPTCDYRFRRPPITAWDPTILTEAGKRFAAPTLTCKCCGRVEDTIATTVGAPDRQWCWGEKVGDDLCRRCYDHRQAETEAVAAVPWGIAAQADEAEPATSEDPENPDDWPVLVESETPCRACHDFTKLHGLPHGARVTCNRCGESGVAP